MSFFRMVRRAMLIPRARRVRFEREFLDLEEFLDDIRKSADPGWRKTYADEVE